MKPAWQLSSPLIAIFSVYGQRVFAADAQQAFDNDAGIPARKPRIRDDGQRFTEERRQPELSAQAVQRGTGDVLATDQISQNTSYRAFAAACRPDHQHDLVQVGAARDNIAEPLAKHINGVWLLRP